MAGKIIDPTKTGNYPVVLSDRLLGKEATEIFTGVRYNHKPDPSSDRTARLKPSTPGQTSSYDMSFTGADGRSTEYAFAGTRTIGDGQYVLYFDPGRDVFVLDRLDSTFHMNLTRTPTNSDPESLAKKHPHIDSSISIKPTKSVGAGGGSGGGGAAASAPANSSGTKAKAADSTKKTTTAAPARKQTAAAADKKKKSTANVSLALPQEDKSKPAKPKSKPQPKPKSGSNGKSRPVDEEDEEDEADDLLLVEYPDGGPKSQNRDFSPAFPSVRRFDEFMDQRESEADDADGESAEEPDASFRLPSPVNQSNRQQSDEEDDDDNDDDDDDGDDDDNDDEGSYGQQQQQQQQQQRPEPEPASPNLEDDLEKDLEEAFEAVEMSNTGTPAGGDGDESEISEED
ncbi:RNA polymerase II transcription elongation factor [Geosmithia morbida]|uniref:RNA polymerase II transcription elongation factor n=1 Tax=Geosmithia morbida TaxID=1094350 RepID=A0A9P4YZD5_9HYPO|nr:RNA polymerase II transcription elongation factor [Geosmithia morbida]KAF4124569.1 RNA polymerase II transcription elongation factor [Geosmithia morbida]